MSLNRNSTPSFSSRHNTHRNFNISRSLVDQRITTIRVTALSGWGGLDGHSNRSSPMEISESIVSERTNTNKKRCIFGEFHSLKILIGPGFDRSSPYSPKAVKIVTFFMHIY